ncbi:MAG: hydroxymethylpyrimidine/phosphomethylpyrimidine kinase [Gammaproteobacteria bacterium]|nr:hydroxymethylpyrimidine/phosphomethylpyrimidine kinase [Gammaproteobacteria bacterium]
MSGLDPTGGAGIQADIEAIASMGCHAAPLVTALTVQDTRGAQACYAVDALQFIEQARHLLADLDMAACKIGLLPDTALVEAVAGILADHPNVPVILDPVLASGRGDSLVDDEVPDAIRALLLPRTTVATPNTAEAFVLARHADTPEAAAHEMMDLGAEYVLITGGDMAGTRIANRLFGHRREIDTFHWERLPHGYHGSGCTLAGAIAGLAAHGRELTSAIHHAQEYTWQALRHGYRIGHGQHVPNRLFWAAHGRAE